MEFGGADSSVGADKSRLNFRAAIVLRLFFVGLCRHLIGRNPHVVHFLLRASHLMVWRVALSAVCYPTHICGGAARMASPSGEALRFVT